MLLGSKGQDWWGIPAKLASLDNNLYVPQGRAGMTDPGL